MQFIIFISFLFSPRHADVVLARHLVPPAAHHPSPHVHLPFDNRPESASNLVEGHYGQTSAKLIYGVFNTPTNSIPGSAVCAFSLQVSSPQPREHFVY